MHGLSIFFTDEAGSPAETIELFPRHDLLWDCHDED